MKVFSILTFTALCIGIFSCSENDDPIVLNPVESKTFNNLYAPQEGGQNDPGSGVFTKFNFAEGKITTHETQWDIAFRGTTIIINGGYFIGLTDEPERTGNAAAYVAEQPFAKVTKVITELLKQDSNSGTAIPTGSNNGWYVYDPAAMIITPKAGTVLVFRTHDGFYAKMEILSYYKDAPATPNSQTDSSRYYTFNYVYQPNKMTVSFEEE